MLDTIATALVVSVAIASWSYYRTRKLAFDHQVWLFEKNKEAAEILTAISTKIVQDH